ncbi:unnamed protein product, partial [Closterium sp. NIES-53]
LFPLPLQPSMLTLYHSLTRHPSQRSPSSPLLLASLAAGWSDWQVRSWAAAVPPSPDTTSIHLPFSTAPHVWLSAGHEQAVWCNQPVAQLSHTLLALVNPRTSQPFSSSNARRAIIFCHLSAPPLLLLRPLLLGSPTAGAFPNEPNSQQTEQQNQQQQQQPQKQQNPQKQQQKQGQRSDGHTAVQLNSAPFMHKWASQAQQSLSFHINLPIEALSLNTAGSSSRALVLLSNVLPCDGLNLTLVISTQQGDAEERHEEGTLDRRKQEERRQGDDKKGKGEEVGEGEDDVSSYDLTRLLVPLPPPPRSNSFSLPVSLASQQVTGQVPQPSPLALLMLPLEIAVGGGGGVRKATLRVNINTNTK